MRTNRPALFAILSIVFFISCKPYSFIDIEVLEPSKVTIPANISKITFINHSMFTEEFYQTYDTVPGEKTGDLLNIQKSGSKEVFNGFIEAINTSPRFDTANIFYLYLIRNDTANPTSPIAWTILDQICKGKNTEVIVALEFFSGNPSVELETTYRWIDGRSYPWSFISLYFEIKTFWRTYECFSRKIIDEFLFIDTLIWETSESSNLIAMENLPEEEEAVRYAGILTGKEYVNRITPGWKKVKRKVYISGNKEMRKVKKQVYSNNWHAAARTWNKLAYSAKKNLACKAAFNMALACEMEGKLDLAVEWAIKSFSTKNKKSTQQYLDIINKRRMDQKKLSQQFYEK